MGKQRAGGQPAERGRKWVWFIPAAIILALGVSLFLCYSRRIPPPPPRVVRFLKPKTSPPPVRVEQRVDGQWQAVEPAIDPPFTG